MILLVLTFSPSLQCNIFVFVAIIFRLGNIHWLMTGRYLRSQWAAATSWLVTPRHAIAQQSYVQPILRSLGNIYTPSLSIRNYMTWKWILDQECVEFNDDSKACQLIVLLDVWDSAEERLGKKFKSYAKSCLKVRCICSLSHAIPDKARNNKRNRKMCSFS